jgi:hypothetical protein
MQALSAKPFVGQELKVRARNTAAAAARTPVVTRASQQDKDAVSLERLQIPRCASFQTSEEQKATNAL